MRRSGGGAAGRVAVPLPRCASGLLVCDDASERCWPCGLAVGALLLRWVLWCAGRSRHWGSSARHHPKPFFVAAFTFWLCFGRGRGGVSGQVEAGYGLICRTSSARAHTNPYLPPRTLTNPHTCAPNHAHPSGDTSHTCTSGRPYVPYASRSRDQHPSGIVRPTTASIASDFGRRALITARMRGSFDCESSSPTVSPSSGRRTRT